MTAAFGIARQLDRLPLTYDECRARFRRATEAAGLELESYSIAAEGPEGQALAIDATTIGARGASRALVLLSGVHGVEGFIGSALERDLIERVPADALPADVAVVIVHAVNPWGMAWWRRQNESNVDLNRNWRRDDGEPLENDAYDEVHHLACPDTPSMPDVDRLLATAGQLVEERGLTWVRDAITTGQYRHADGLHFGGDRTEESTRVVETLASRRLVDRDKVLVVDLHTGHGRPGQVTLLSDASPGEPQDAFFRYHFPTIRVEATAGNPDATTGLKSGQIANGIRGMLPAGACFSTSAEFGTVGDLEQLAATYREHWVHRHGDRAVPEHRDAIWAYRCCFTPDDSSWERTALTAGRSLLDQAVAAVARW